MLLMLEDDSDRIQRFQAAVRSIDPGLPLIIWRDAPSMIRDLESYLPQARLISLDHDLEPLEGGPSDPGTGLDVARHLAAMTPGCDVIIHSSNTTRSIWMSGEFELGGWRSQRVAPIGEDWIETHWRYVVAKLLKATRAS
jgi:hypothetical protein